MMVVVFYMCVAQLSANDLLVLYFVPGNLSFLLSYTL